MQMLHVFHNELSQFLKIINGKEILVIFDNQHIGVFPLASLIFDFYLFGPGRFFVNYDAH